MVQSAMPEVLTEVLTGTNQLLSTFSAVLQKLRVAEPLGGVAEIDRECTWYRPSRTSTQISVARNSGVLRGRRFELGRRRLSSAMWGASRLMSCEIMMFRNRAILRKAVRRLAGLGVLFGISAVVLPFPIKVDVPSSSNADKDLSKPFPCMNRPCGCRSAEQCWKKCCCFTDLQKVAWAKANGVMIPQFVVAAAKTEEHDDGGSCLASTSVRPISRVEIPAEPPRSAGASNKKSSRTSCCCGNAHKRVVAPAVAVLTRDERSCGSVHADCVEAKHGATCCSKKRPVRTKWVLALKAAECQGQGAFWLTLPPAIIPAWPVLPPNQRFPLWREVV